MLTCGWCADDSTCRSEKGSCKDWIWYSAGCPTTTTSTTTTTTSTTTTLPSGLPCNHYTDCVSCTQQRQCNWCETTKECVDLLSAEMCNEVIYRQEDCSKPPTDRCKQYRDCTSCTIDPSCGWCADDSTCRSEKGSCKDWKWISEQCTKPTSQCKAYEYYDTTQGKCVCRDEACDKVCKNANRGGGKCGKDATYQYQYEDDCYCEKLTPSGCPEGTECLSQDTCAQLHGSCVGFSSNCKNENFECCCKKPSTPTKCEDVGGVCTGSESCYNQGGICYENKFECVSCCCIKRPTPACDEDYFWNALGSKQGKEEPTPDGKYKVCYKRDCIREIKRVEGCQKPPDFSEEEKRKQWESGYSLNRMFCTRDNCWYWVKFKVSPTSACGPDHCLDVRGDGEWCIYDTSDKKWKWVPESSVPLDMCCGDERCERGIENGWLPLNCKDKTAYCDKTEWRCKCSDKPRPSPPQYSITNFYADTQEAIVNTQVTFHVYSNVPSTQTGYYLRIYDKSSSTLLKTCSNPSGCTFQLTSSTPGTICYLARVEDSNKNVVSSTGTACVNWKAEQMAYRAAETFPTFTLTLSTSSLKSVADIGESVTLIAYSNVDIGQTPYYITIYEDSTLIKKCISGKTCIVTRTFTSRTSKTYVARIESLLGVRASSDPLIVSWI